MDYGYQTTTSYGAQGGANGGGFMGGSQQGSQDGAGSKTYGKDTVRPVTIKQILEAHQPHPDSDFKIDDVEVTQLSFVGQVNMISAQTTNHTFQIDDGTGVIDVKQWIDVESEENPKALPKEGDYVHIWGRLKAFNNKRHVGSHVIRTITDYNEVSCHLLEATAVHLYFVRGPPGTSDGMKSEGGGQGMFVDGYGAGAAAQQNGGGKKLSPKISQAAKKMYAFLQSSPQNNEGLHAQTIATQMGMPVNDVFKASDELLGEGAIYTTVDDETWAILEY